MVVQSIKFNNSNRKVRKQLKDIYTGDLMEIYLYCVMMVCKHLWKKLTKPCCDRLCPPGDYSMNGSYTRRKPIVDVYMDKQGVFHKKVYEGFEIHLIECTEHENHTCCHALLFDLFVPYESFTLRAIFYYLHLFLEGSQSVDDFCYDHNIPIDTFMRWRKWTRDHFASLFGTGNVYAGTRKHLAKNDLQRFYDLFQYDYLGFFKRTIDLFNASVFQTRSTPAHSVKLCGRPLC